MSVVTAQQRPAGQTSMSWSSSGSVSLHLCCALCCRTEAREELRNQVGNLRFDLNTVIETSSKSKADKKDAQSKKKEFLAKVGRNAISKMSGNSHGDQVFRQPLGGGSCYDGAVAY